MRGVDDRAVTVRRLDSQPIRRLIATDTNVGRDPVKVERQAELLQLTQTLERPLKEPLPLQPLTFGLLEGAKCRDNRLAIAESHEQILVGLRIRPHALKRVLRSEPERTAFRRERELIAFSRGTLGHGMGPQDLCESDVISGG